MHFDCPNGHIIIGSSFCTLCESDRSERWLYNQYVRYHADMAYELGLFKGVDISPLQESLLASTKIRETHDEAEARDANFEQQFWLHNPEGFHKWKKQQEEDRLLGIDGIEWKTPQSLEEASEISKILQQVMNGEGEEIDLDDDENASFINFPAEQFGFDTSLLKDDE